MLIIITTALGVLLLGLYISEGNSVDGIRIESEDSFWYQYYKEELNTRLKQVRDADQVSCDDILNVYDTIEQKAKRSYRNLKLIFAFCFIFTFAFLTFSTYEEVNVTKYELIEIKDDNILRGLSKDVPYYMCEYSNKENSYMFYYKGEYGPDQKEIFASNVIKYKNIDCSPCIIEEKKVVKSKCDLLQKILFFNLFGTQTREMNYKFYILDENIIKIYD